MTDLQDRVLVTGHILEWLAMAPEEIHPSDDVLMRATGWLKATILGLTDSQVRRHYTFLSHAGKALTLWRGQLPAEFWREQLKTKKMN